MREFDLQPPFGSGGAFAEDLKDQPGTVDHLGFERGFEIALLHGRQARVEDDEVGLVLADLHRKLLDLTAADQRRRLGRPHPYRDLFGHDEADRSGQPRGLVEPGVGIAMRIALVGQDDQRAAAAGEIVTIAIEAIGHGQSSVSPSSARLSARAGWIVDTACL